MLRVSWVYLYFSLLYYEFFGPLHKLQSRKLINTAEVQGIDAEVESDVSKLMNPLE